MGKWYHVCIPLECSSSKENMDTTEKRGNDSWKNALGMAGRDEIEYVSGGLGVR